MLPGSISFNFFLHVGPVDQSLANNTLNSYMAHFIMMFKGNGPVLFNQDQFPSLKQSLYCTTGAFLKLDLLVWCTNP